MDLRGEHHERKSVSPRQQSWRGLGCRHNARCSGACEKLLASPRLRLTIYAAVVPALPGGWRRTGPNPTGASACVYQTTERYPGCKQRIRAAVNDNIRIEPAG